MNRYVKSILGISSISILALGLVGCSHQPRHQTTYKRTPKTHKVHMILPSVPPKIRGSFLFNISSDDINEILHINQHYLYLQSGTNIGKPEKEQVVQQIKSQYAGTNKKPSQACINKQWDEFVKENKSNNQTHLKLQIHSYTQNNNLIIVKGYDQQHHFHVIKLHIMPNDSIKMNAGYAKKSIGNLVKKMTFQKCSTENAETVLKDDQIKKSVVGYN